MMPFDRSVRQGALLEPIDGVDVRATIEQKTHDLRWIRHEFLDHREDHGHIVVHGHTIAPDPEFRRNRIGIDTGAYMHGKLTALVLEGSSRRLIIAGDNDGTIAIETRNAA